MFALPLSRWLQARGIHYAWIVAAVAFLTMLTAAATIGLPGAFLQPLAREFGWDIGQMSSALAVRFALFGLLGPFAAVLMARYGLRRIIGAAMLLIATGLALATRMHALWQFQLLWGVVLGIGSGLTALVLGATVANQWFERRRGLVMGLLTASTATGQLVFLPLAAWLIEHHGWRVAVLPTLAMCALVITLAAMLVRSRPEEIGLRPYGADAAAPPPAASTPPRRPRMGDPVTALVEALRNPMFWLLAGTFFVCGLSTNGLIQTHFISLCADYGLAPVPAASVLAMIGAFDFVGTIASGWLTDRYAARRLLFWYYGLRGLSLLWLPHSDFTLYGLSLFAMFYGLDWVATVPPTMRLANQSFERARVPMIFGWVFAAHQLGGAVAAYGGGLSRTVLASYSPALYTAGVACLCAAVSMLVVRPRRPDAVAGAAPAATRPAC
ncbi:MAG: MFS transporter [Burkholderiales bacterium]|nr:MFS transporter [Burkholderiales bacterium]